MQHSVIRHVLGVVTAMIAAIALFVGIALPASAMTVTFIRHGESQGNASGFIDTKVPGPPLTGEPTDPAGPETGWSQSKAVATTLNNAGTYSGIYASTMVRTQQTATPFAALVNHGGDMSQVTVSGDPYHPDFNNDIVVLNGLQEISAGAFEGSPEGSGLGRIGYIMAPVLWTLGLRFARIPGSEDGNEFDARVDGALDQIAAQDGADSDPAVFSHGATIMFWTMMNVDNPDLTLLLAHPLKNTDIVVVESNGDGGWTLKSWAGQDVAPATLPTQLFVNFRDLIVAPQTALYNLRAPLLALDFPGVIAGVQQGISDVAQAAVTFVVRSAKDIADAIGGIGQAPAPAAVTAVTAVTSKKVQLGAPEAAATTSSVATSNSSNGATDLSDGNKVEPVKALSTASRNTAKAAPDATDSTSGKTAAAPSGKKGTSARTAKDAA